MMIKVKVTTDSKKEEILQIAPDTYSVKVCAKPERNLANNETRRLIARHFGIMENAVRLIKGAHKPNKIFEIRN